MTTTPAESVQCFGRKKTAVAVTHCQRGRGLIKISGVPIELVQPEILRYKAFEPILLLDRHRFAGVDMRIRVKGGGHTSQIYAIRQSITKALVAYYQKFVDEESKKEIKDILEEFEQHAEKAKTLPEGTTNEDKLILYGFFKQSTVGPVNTSRPGIFNMRGRAKWDAWKAVEGKSKEEAMGDYITKVKQLLEAAD